MQIEINIENKKPRAKENYKIVCGNSDYTILFSFDAEWQPYEKKTARFNFTQDGTKKYIDVLFSGNECPMPVLSKTSLVEIGVYAGELQTTTPCILPCEKSILCDCGMQTDPPEDVYSQLLNSIKEPYIGENENWFVWDIETKSFVDTGVKATADYSAVEKVDKDLQKYKEQNNIWNNGKLNKELTDININADSIVKEITFYGTIRENDGATLSTPKTLIYPEKVNIFYCNNQGTVLDEAALNYPFLATNNYRDSGFYDDKTKKIHYKKIIKKIVLDGTEGTVAWKKSSGSKGRYYVNLHTIDGIFTSEDLKKLNNQIAIAYNDAKCSIATDYVTNTLTKSGQFKISQGYSSGKGYFRFEFFEPEFETLDEVLAAVQKNPVTLLIPMIYDVQEYSFDLDLSSIIKQYAENPITIKLYGGGRFDNNLYGFNLSGEFTYNVDNGLFLQKLKNAIIALGGNV